MNVEDQIKVVQKAVESFYQQVQNDSYMPELYESQKQHVIQIGTSILCTRWGIGYEGGGFVQSVVNNDLMGAIGQADGTNIKMLPFYCKMIYNVGLPNELKPIKK